MAYRVETLTELLTEAEKLERSADMLYASLLRPSMAEKAMREDAAALREQAIILRPNQREN
jgi:hypothetical protein